MSRDEEYWLEEEREFRRLGQWDTHDDLPKCTETAIAYPDSESVTTGLIDSIMTNAAALRERLISSQVNPPPEVADGLFCLAIDDDLAWIMQVAKRIHYDRTGEK